MKDIQKEITPIAADDLFIVLNHPNAKFDYPVHYHPDYEINLVMDTYGSRIVGDSVEAFEALDLIMIGPNLPHAWKGEVVEGNHVITIQFSDKLLNFPILEKRLFNPIKQLLLESQRGIQIVCTFITRKPSGTQSDVTYRLAFVSQLFHTGLSGNLQ